MARKYKYNKSERCNIMSVSVPQFIISKLDDLAKHTNNNRSDALINLLLSTDPKAVNHISEVLNETRKLFAKNQSALNELNKNTSLINDKINNPHKLWESFEVDDTIRNFFESKLDDILGLKEQYRYENNKIETKVYNLFIEFLIENNKKIKNPIKAKEMIKIMLIKHKMLVMI